MHSILFRLFITINDISINGSNLEYWVYFSIKLYFEKNNKESLISSSPLEFKTFMVYWLPLVPWTILSASVEIFDRWILNSSGGLEEQAFLMLHFNFLQLFY